MSAVRALTLAALLAMPAHVLAQDEEPFDVSERYGPAVQARATFYGPGYAGRPLGCGGTYWPSDPSIVAVGPAHYGAMPCGTVLRITGPAGSIEAVRRDSCPGCSPSTFDLSDAGNAAVCGWNHTCSVTVEVRR